MHTRLCGVPITRTPDYTVDTKEYYARHVMSAEDAVSVVKSGDHVAICRGREPEALGLALVARKDELQSVKVTIPQPGRDSGLFDVASWSENFPGAGRVRHEPRQIRRRRRLHRISCQPGHGRERSRFGAEPELRLGRLYGRGEPSRRARVL